MMKHKLTLLILSFCLSAVTLSAADSSDKRGTIYGIYELSRQLGVSPWHYWADVPSEKHADVYVQEGCYTDGEPKVRYRGITSGRQCQRHPRLK